MTRHKIYCKLPRIHCSVVVIFATSTLIRSGEDRDITRVRFRNIFSSSAALCICIRHAQKRTQIYGKGNEEREKKEALGRHLWKYRPKIFMAAGILKGK